jgi:hypothetical protein
VNTALVVNCSPKSYNLGVAKLRDWLTSEGWRVDTMAGDPGLMACGYDLVCLSVVFSWDAPTARAIALRVKPHSDVWCGGPGMTALAGWWKRETGLECSVGLDWRFERWRGSYPFTFASRGCPVGCYFCIVPRIEGKEFTLDPDFVPAPILCDNNLSALPAEYQDHIIQRYQETGTPLKDANSGFEPATFTEETYARWKAVLRGPWRFAFDELSEEAQVRRMMEILRAESPRRKQVYVLAGNEPIAACLQRAQQVIAWGGEPYVQFVRPLNYLGGPLRCRHDWTEQTGRDFCRYFNRHLWRSLPISDYVPRIASPPPFAQIRETEPVSLPMVGELS